MLFVVMLILEGKNERNFLNLFKYISSNIFVVVTVSPFKWGYSFSIWILFVRGALEMNLIPSDKNTLSKGEKEMNKQGKKNCKNRTMRSKHCP